MNSTSDMKSHDFLILPEKEIKRTKNGERGIRSPGNRICFSGCLTKRDFMTVLPEQVELQSSERAIFMTEMSQSFASSHCRNSDVLIVHSISTEDPGMIMNSLNPYSSESPFQSYV